MVTRRLGLMTRRGTGVWIAERSRWRLLWRSHDALFVAVRHLRLRIIKPWRKLESPRKPE